MKKIILATVAIALLVLESNAQNMEWAKTFGNAGDDFAHSVATDLNGNILTTGRFLTMVDFDPGPGTTNLTSNGGSDIFIQKFDSNGNLIWAKAFGSTQDDFVYSITTDASGNIYTTGYYWGTTDFDPNAGVSNLTANGQNDVFVQKLDPNGNLIWAKSFGGPFWDFGQFVSIDASGNVLITGYFTGTADFDPGVGVLNYSSIGSSDVFVEKLDSNGNFLWAKAIGGSNSERGEAVRADINGNVYTVGQFDGSVDFDPSAGTSILTSNGVQDVFIQKMDPSGNFLWAKTFGGTSVDIAYGLEINQAGEIYTTGYFFGTVDFDPGVGVLNYTSNGNSDIFIQKMDPSGNMLWTKVMGGFVDDQGRSLSLDVNGNVYATGRFQSTVDFDPNAGISNLITNGSTDVFVQKLDPNGDLLWARSFGGNGFDFGLSISVDANDNVYALGDFAGTADFDPNAGTFNLTSNGLNDVFLEKITQCVPVANPIVPTDDLSTVNCIADAIQPTAPAVTDECGISIVPVVTVSANPACEGDLIYTFTYTDAEGNYSVYTYTYTIAYASGPVVPSNDLATVNCISDAVQPTAPMVNDQCGNALTPVITENTDPICEGDKIYTFTYTDCASNIAVYTFTYSIVYANAPVVPSNDLATVNCISDAVQPTAPVVIDQCGNALTPVITENTDPICEGDKIYTFTYTDCASNIAVYTYTYSIVYANAPVVPSNDLATVNCISDAVQPTAPAVTDQCGNTLAPVITENTDPICEGNKIYTFTYTDCASNIAVYTYTYSIVYANAPVVPSNDLATVNCISDAVQPTAPVVTDQCGNALTPVITENTDPICEGDKIYTFTYTDCASNIAVYTFTYSIVYANAPVVPSNDLSIVSCIADAVQPVAPIVIDQCGNALTPVITENADPICSGDKIYTFTYTDCVGNSDVYLYTYTISDNINPTGSNPATLNVECIGDVPVPNVLVVTDEDDNCSLAPAVTFVSDVSDGLSNPETITRTYSIQDECGNSINVVQQIIVQDLTAPTLDTPCMPEISEVCDVTSLTTPSAADNCSGTVTITHNAILPITSSTTVTWTLVDVYGNSSTYDQIVAINPIDVTTVTVNNGIVAMNSNADSYQWVDCNNNYAPILGENGQTFSPTDNGSYAVEITIGNCTETSACENISTIGLKENSLTSVNLFPNPTFSTLTIETDHIIEKVSIYDMTGALVQEDFESSFSVATLSPGAYITVISTNIGTVKKRFIKQ